MFFPYVCIGKPYVCNVSTHVLHEWMWPCEYMNATTFTRFAKNCNIGRLVALYSSAMHVALSTGAIPSFAVLHTEKLAFQCAKLGVGSGDKAYESSCIMW